MQTVVSSEVMNMLDNPHDPNEKLKAILALDSDPNEQQVLPKVVIEQDTFARTVRISVNDKAMPVFVYQDEKVVDVIAEVLFNVGIECIVDETWDVEEIYNKEYQSTTRTIATVDKWSTQ